MAVIEDGIAGEATFGSPAADERLWESFSRSTAASAGPWTMSGWDVYCPDGCLVASVASAAHSIEWRDHGDMSSARDNARDNARLVRAAPIMLAALLDARLTLSCKEGVDVVLAIVEAAIAQATLSGGEG